MSVEICVYRIVVYFVEISSACHMLQDKRMNTYIQDFSSVEVHYVQFVLKQ